MEINELIQLAQTLSEETSNGSITPPRLGTLLLGIADILGADKETTQQALQEMQMAIDSKASITDIPDVADLMDKVEDLDTTVRRMPGVVTGLINAEITKIPNATTEERGLMSEQDKKNLQEKPDCIMIDYYIGTERKIRLDNLQNSIVAYGATCCVVMCKEVFVNEENESYFVVRIQDYSAYQKDWIVRYEFFEFCDNNENVVWKKTVRATDASNEVKRAFCEMIATPEHDGLMSAEDKKVLADITVDIRTLLRKVDHIEKFMVDKLGYQS